MSDEAGIGGSLVAPMHDSVATGLWRETSPEGIYADALQLGGGLLWQGAAALPLLDRIGEAVRFSLPPRAAAQAILTGAAHAACLAESQWYKLWPAIQSNLFPFLLAVQQRSRNKHFANQVKYNIINIIILKSDKNKKYIINNTCVDKIDIFAPGRDLTVQDDSIVKAVLNIYAAGSILGNVCLPMREGRLLSGAICDALALHLGPAIADLLVSPDGGVAESTRPKWEQVETFLDQVLAGPGELVEADDGQGAGLECTTLASATHTGDATSTYAVKIAGVDVGQVRLPRAASASPQTLHSAVRTVAGADLLRIIMREAVIARPRASIAEVRQRLARQAKAAETQPDDGRRMAGSEDLSRLTFTDRGEVANLITRTGPENEGQGRRGFFERLYASVEDPWNYDNAYDDTKYDQTLSLVTRSDIDLALEIACAGGHFTSRLAPKVKRLTATDISLLALQRAAERCANFSHVKFEAMDVGRSEIRDTYDLIVCSEVLYYLPDLGALNSAAARIAGALNEGGQLLLAHAHVIADEPDKPGFDWRLPFGGKVIGEIFAALPNLQLVAEIVTPLYRIQSYINSGGSGSAKAGVQRQVFNRLPVPLPERIATAVRWSGGPVEPRPHPAPAWATSLPILMYHRVAPAANPELARYCVQPADFAAQMAFLTDAGYYGIGWETLLAHLTYAIPFPGLPVVITFDDGYADFVDHALPILEKNGFTATIFIVTDEIGGYNTWDSAYGPQIALLGEAGLSQLRGRGMHLGSHTASHAPLAILPPTEMARELRSSRQRLEALLGNKVEIVAYPHGSHDQIVAQAAAAAGYMLGVTSRAGHCELSDTALSLPRVAIFGDTTFDKFVTLVSPRKLDTTTAPLRRTSRFLMRLGQSEQAVDLVRHWVDRYPWNLNLHLELTDLLEELGQGAKASAALEAAREAELPDVSAYARLGAALEARGRIEEAIELARRAALVFAGDPRPHQRLGRLLMRAGVHEEAASAYRLAIKADPQRSPAYKALAAVLERLDCGNEAVDVLNEASRCCPEDAGLELALGRLLSRLERFAEARPLLARAVELPDAVLDTWLRLARAHERLGDGGEAMKTLEVARERFADEPDIYNRLAALLTQQKDYTAAEVALRRAIALKPDDAGLHLRLGQACASQGRQKEADAIIRAAARRFPDNAALRQRLEKLSQT